MNRIKGRLMGIGLALMAIASRADELTPATNNVSTAPYHPFTISGDVGTTGAGGGANWRFSDHFGMGGTMEYFPYNYTPTIAGIDFDSHLTLMSETALLNLYPWRKHSFHFNVGALFNQNHLTGSKTGTVDLNGTPYTGTVSMDVKQQPVDPYISLGGNLYFDKGHHVSLGAEAGVFYTGEPRVSVTAAGAASGDVKSLQDEVVHYARKAEFWPVLKLSLNYSF
jgi:hypothetical protein